MNIPAHLTTTKQGYELVPGDVIVDDDGRIGAVYGEKRHPFSIALDVVWVTPEGDDDDTMHVHRSQHVIVLRDTTAFYEGPTIESALWRVNMSNGTWYVRNANAPDLADALKQALMHFVPEIAQEMHDADR